MWRPNQICDISRLERVQCKATKYILGPTTASYKDRLVSLKILPLMQWFELHDILFLVKCIKNPPDNFSLSDYFTFTSGPTRSTSNFKLKHTFSKFSATRHFYFNRITRLWNSLPPIDTTKSILTNFLWSNFLKSFNSSNPCSFHFLCPCNKCVTVGFSTFFSCKHVISSSFLCCIVVAIQSVSHLLSYNKIISKYYYFITHT